MKAKIKMDPASKSGILQIIPENDTEAYALWSWWRRYGDLGDGGDRDSILQVKELEQVP